MIGLTLQFWEPEDPDYSLGFLKMIRDYCGAGHFGHVAMKLVLPIREDTQKLVRATCYQEDGILQLVPHFLTEVEIDNPVTREKQSVSCFEVYFSWYPDGIYCEDDTRIKESVGKKKLTKEEENLLSNSPEAKAFEEARLSWQELEDKMKNTSQGKELEALRAQSRDHYLKAISLRNALMKVVFPARVCDREVHLPIQFDEKAGLNYEKILKKMREFATDYDFDITYLNCSHAVRYVLLEGMDENFVNLIQPHTSFWDRLPALFDNPTRVLWTALKLKQALSLGSNPSPAILNQYQPHTLLNHPKSPSKYPLLKCKL